MKKTVTANISGMVFHIDEDAYEKLNAYMANVRRSLEMEDGTDEILADIESRIAEMFQEKITASKTVITIEDVQNIITQLGEPEDFENKEEEKKSAGEKSQSSHTYEKRQKRLFRDPDDSYIAGVSGGLGAFFNLDPVWMRAAFIVFTFVYGFGPVLYIILWIVVPKARTTAEKLEMRGEDVTISNIEKSIKEELNELKQNFKEFSEEAKESFKSKGKSKEKRKTSPDYKTRRNRNLTRALTIAAGIILLVLSFSMLMAIISSVYLIPVALGTSLGIWHFSLAEVLSAFLGSQGLTSAAMAGLILVLGIPVLWIILMAVQLIFNFRPKLKFLGAVSVVLWFAGLSLILSSSVSAMRNFAAQHTVSREYTLTTSQWPNLYLEANPSPDPTTRAFKPGHTFSGLQMFFSDEEQAAGVPIMNISKSDSDEISLKIVRKARGNNRHAAMQNASAIEYEFSQTDSLLTFEPLFFFSKDGGWRNQQVYLELSIPHDKNVFIPEDLKKDFIVQWHQNVKVIEQN